MLSEKIDKFRCYGEKISFNEDICYNEHCQFLTGCKIVCGHHERGLQWHIIDKLHENHTAGEVMGLLQVNFNMSYNAAKQSLKRWRIKQNDM